MIEKEEDGIKYLVPEIGADIQKIRAGIASGEILSKPAVRDWHRYRVIGKRKSESVKSEKVNVKGEKAEPKTVERENVET